MYMENKYIYDRGQLSPTMLASNRGAWVRVLAVRLLIQLPASASQKATRENQVFEHLSTMWEIFVEWSGVSGSWLWHGAALNIVAVWRVDQQVEYALSCISDK